MRYHALACDYDGTLALYGRVDEPTLAALERLLATGRKAILVTGRELDELQAIFPELRLFEWVVAENGALLYRPSNHEEKALGPPPPQSFLERLGQEGVAPISVGRVIVATWHPHENTVLKVIRDLGLDLQVIFNKGAVMVLPAGINKATGLAAALELVGLSAHEVVAVGDAENDHAFLSFCECAVAVDNALPALKDHADMVTRGDHGTGVTELIDAMIATDLREQEECLTRHHPVIGVDERGDKVRLASFGPNVLIAGPSGSGKSTVATSILERLAEKHYQYCIIDPEGDYDALETAVTLGGKKRPPGIPEILQLLSKPTDNAVVNLVGLPIGDRPPFFVELMLHLLQMRGRTGRPHWLIVDETHHLLPSSWEPGSLAFSKDLNRTLFITVHPDQVSPAVLASIGTVIAVGGSPEATIEQFCKALHEPAPLVGSVVLEAGEVVLWPRAAQEPPRRVRITPSKTERRRHIRKYAEGELPPERSFYFRGPEGKLNLRAQNLQLFMQLAEGVDDATWMHHLQQGDYSQWCRERIKDAALADEVQAIERRSEVLPAESRKLICEAINRRYTLPTSAPLPVAGTAAASLRGSAEPPQ